MSLDSTGDRRVHFADWLVSPQMDTKYYSRYFVKWLPVELLLDAMSQVFLFNY